MDDFASRTDATQEFLDSLPELEPGATFLFACHPGVECFNACCGDLTLMLTPYDVMRLRRALGLDSREMIQRHLEVAAQPGAFPSVRLKMAEGEGRPCPFVTPEGCSIYPDRPGACRTYPLGRAARPDGRGGVCERHFVVREDHCKGFAAGRDWTAEQWLQDQGLEPFTEYNDRYMRLMAKQRATGRGLDARQVNMAFLALYQLDNFQRFLREMRVFERVEAPEERQQAVFADEEACLDFGLDWLELVLTGSSDTLAPKAGSTPGPGGGPSREESGGQDA